MSEPTKVPIALLGCRHGLFFVLLSDLYIGRSLAAYGEYSEIEVAFLTSLVRPGATILDVGANIGSITVPLARAVGPTGRVLAFEPQTFLHRILRANVAVNDLASVAIPLRAAVGEEPGHVDVPILDYARDDNYGGFDISLRDFTDQPSRAVAAEPVPLLTIDALDLPACDLIKIDVECMELDVVFGAAATIERHRPVVYLEVSRKAPALLMSLDALGYRAWWRRPPLFNPANHRRRAENSWPGVVSCNVVCLHADRPLAEETVRRHALIPILDPFAAPGQSRPGRIADGRVP